MRVRSSSEVVSRLVGHHPPSVRLTLNQKHPQGDGAMEDMMHRVMQEAQNLQGGQNKLSWGRCDCADNLSQRRGLTTA